MPAELVSGLSPSISVQPPPIQSAFGDPEPHCQRPFTQKPPSTFTALPEAANTPAIKVSGAANTSRTAASDIRASAKPVVAPMKAIHPQAASTSASASNTCAATLGGT